MDGFSVVFLYGLDCGAAAAVCVRVGCLIQEASAVCRAGQELVIEFPPVYQSACERLEVLVKRGALPFGPGVLLDVQGAEPLADSPDERQCVPVFHRIGVFAV